jgi:ATP-binding cassette subfamily B protein
LDIIWAPVEITDAQRAKPLHVIRGKIEFREVDFSYHENQILHSLDLTIAAQEKIAFVGPSGSGKTTLVKLLVGLYRPEAGHITFNQLKVENIDLEELRRQIGLVTQDTQVFSGSIRDNLKFVLPTATDEALLEVLRRSATESLMQRATLGLSTVIGEGGVKLSGGAG